LLRATIHNNDTLPSPAQTSNSASASATRKFDPVAADEADATAPAPENELGNNNDLDLNVVILPHPVDVPRQEDEEHRQRRNRLFLQDNVGQIMRDPRVEVCSTVLVLVSSMIAALSTVSSIDLRTYANMLRIENCISYVFAVEFIMRWYSQFELSSKSIIQYLTKPLVMVDLVVVILPLIPLVLPASNTGAYYDNLPSFLFSSSSLINLRLLRVLRLQRVLADMDSFLEFQRALGIIKATGVDDDGRDGLASSNTQVKPYELQLARVILSIFTLVSVSTGLIYSVEHEANPAIPDYFTALYFVTTTLTTVGFGDITPVTPEGKLVVSLSIMAGVAVIPALAATFVEASVLAFNDANGSKIKKQDQLFESNDDEKNTETMTMMSLPNGVSSSMSSSTPMTTASQSRPPPLNPFNSKQDRDVVTTHVQSCSACGASDHRTSARFCWNCGSRLHDNDF
jgi:voltage-gated potassium channel Kch